MTEFIFKVKLPGKALGWGWEGEEEKNPHNIMQDYHNPNFSLFSPKINPPKSQWLQMKIGFLSLPTADPRYPLFLEGH